jgi:hypothetical protein
MTPRIAILTCAAILLIALAIWLVAFRTRSVANPNPERAQRVKEAYLPLRDDSTFEFTIESVGSHDGSAMALISHQGHYSRRFIAYFLSDRADPRLSVSAEPLQDFQSD